MKSSRRTFLKLAAAAAASAAFPQEMLAATTETISVSTIPNAKFEVSASTYAWELYDEGIPTVLDNMQTMAAVNSVYLIALMHPERRPLSRGDFPHNPVRKNWMAEDARIYWHPDLKRYGRIKPKLSDNTWLNETDWMRKFVDETRKRGLKTGAEISHVVVDVERARGELADLAERNVDGAITAVRPQLQPLCPNQPDVREYILALATDLLAQYDIDYLQSCIISMDEDTPPRKKGGCFCDACKKAAKAQGIDLAAIQAAMQKNYTGEPAYGEWRAFRNASVADFYAFLHYGMAKLKPSIEIRYNLHQNERNPLDWGIDLPLLEGKLQSARIQDYTEQNGRPEQMPAKLAYLKKIRDWAGPSFPLHAAIGVRLDATPELVHQGVQYAVEAKMQGITLGHYDGATFPILKAVREGLLAAGKPA